MIRVLDKLVLKSFIPPYLVAFCIAEFVLVMQFLWKYIDEIIGKGVSMGVILELVFYFGVTIIPLAIPITILISSVMVFGNMSERHELSSFKSGGVSLIRIMGAGILLAFMTAIFSLIASNFLKPSAYYQYIYRFNSIKKQKSSLSIVPGEFNRDFRNFVFLVGKKEKESKDIEDVVIYDHSGGNPKLMNMVQAQNGEMYLSKGGKYFIMNLFKGEQIKEDTENYDKETKKRSFPLVRTKFEEWHKTFDMSQFDLAASNLDLSRKKYDLMNALQLMAEIDSFNNKITIRTSKNNLSFQRLLPAKPKPEKLDSVTQNKFEEKASHYAQKISEKNQANKLSEPITESKKPIGQSKTDTLKEEMLPWDENNNVYSSLIDKYKESNTRTLKSAHTGVIRKRDLFLNNVRDINNYGKYLNVYILRLHQQFSWALICIIFLFIGAPLGSIIRKGGYGYPLLFSIVFFMIFIILNILGEKLNKSGSIQPIIAAWLPCIVLAPFALFLTIKAVNEAQFNLTPTRISEAFGKLKSMKEK